MIESQLFNIMVKLTYLFLYYGLTKESDELSDDPNRVDSLLE
ncbi:hypothetical protein ACIQXU_18430 [Peribacillus sp. NPDC097284]